MIASLLRGDRLLEALRIPRAGEIFDLSLLLRNDEVVWPGHGPFAHYQWMTHSQGSRFLGDETGPSRVGMMSDRVELPLHAGTHVDALNHFSLDGRLFSGDRVVDVEVPHGTTVLGIETSPVMISECIVINMERHHGRPMESGEPVTLPSMRDAISEQGIERIPPDSVVLVHTGWMRSTYARSRREYFLTEPGIDVEAAIFLAEAGVRAIGADSSAVEVVRGDEEDPYPVHQELIVRRGVHLLENVVTEALADRASGSCLFIASPLPIEGASGSPLRALAIV